MKRIRWEIDVDVRTPTEAARKALAIQRDPDSITTVFDVTDRDGTVRVDLSDNTVRPTSQSRRR